MKKYIYISFLLLANALLLAYSIIPHHHHDKVSICFFHSHCCSDEHNHGDNEHDCTEHHNNTNTSDNCIIKEAYTRTDNNYKQDRYFNLNVNTIPEFLILFYAIPKVKISDLNGIPFRQNPYPQLSYYTSYIARTIGMRAPPSC